MIPRAGQAFAHEPESRPGIKAVYPKLLVKSVKPACACGQNTVPCPPSIFMDPGIASM